MLAVPAALALHDLQASRRMTVQDRFLRSLVESSSAMSSTAGLDELLQRVAQEASEALHTSQAAVYIHDPEQDALVYRVFHVRAAPARMTRSVQCVGSRTALATRRSSSATTSSWNTSPTPTCPPIADATGAAWTKGPSSASRCVYDDGLGLLRLYEFEEERMFTPLELQFARGLWVNSPARRSTMRRVSSVNRPVALSPRRCSRRARRC